MKISQPRRVLEILHRLSSCELVCTKRLAEEFYETERTIQRDLKILKEFLDDNILQCERGCYKLLPSSEYLKLFAQKEDTKILKSFFEFLSLMDTKTLQFLEEDDFLYLKQLKKDTNEIYTIFDNPIEELHKTEFLDDIKLAVKDRRYCDIVYYEDTPLTLKDIKPQKILYAKNNWYLAAMTQAYEENSGFKRFRINYIERFTLKPKQFHKDIQIQMHIQNMQTLFEKYNRKTYEVQIWVDKEVSRYFLVKKFLKSQEIIDNRDGNLLLNFQINDDMEIIPLIRNWIPYLKIISPDSLKMRFKQQIKEYLEKL